MHTFMKKIGFFPPHCIFDVQVLVRQRQSKGNTSSAGTYRTLCARCRYSFVLSVLFLPPCTLHLDVFRLAAGKVLSLEDTPALAPVAVSGVLHLLVLLPSRHE